MNKIFFTCIFLIPILLFTSCTDSNEKKNKLVVKDGLADNANPDSTLIAPANKVTWVIEKGVLYEVSRLHLFTDEHRMDTFNVQVVGKDYSSAQVHISIKNTVGKEIYSDSLPMVHFMESEGYDRLSTKEKEAHIKKRLDAMLTDDQFEKPAEVLANNDPEMSDPEAHKEFSADKSAIGFIMRLGYEDVIHIAWSKKRGKVVVYFSCC